MFLENTFVLIDPSGECVLVDPGNSTPAEDRALEGFLSLHNLRPVRLLNTHGHVDHVCGNAFVAERYGLEPEIPAHEVPNLEAAEQLGKMFGFSIRPSPPPGRYIAAGETITFGETTLDVLFTPGHSEGHVSFYHAASKQLLSGDVLFKGSIGRYDLPGGNFHVLMQTITDVLLPLGDDVRVYSGHGPSTTIGHERQTNPFLLA